MKGHEGHERRWTENEANVKGKEMKVKGNDSKMKGKWKEFNKKENERK